MLPVFILYMSSCFYIESGGLHNWQFINRIFWNQPELTVRFNWFLKNSEWMCFCIYSQIKKEFQTRLSKAIEDIFDKLFSPFSFSLKTDFWTGNISLRCTLLHWNSKAFSDLSLFFVVVSMYGNKQQIMVKFSSQQILLLIYIKSLYKYYWLPKAIEFA